MEIRDLFQYRLSISVIRNKTVVEPVLPSWQKTHVKMWRPQWAYDRCYSSARWPYDIEILSVIVWGYQPATGELSLQKSSSAGFLFFFHISLINCWTISRVSSDSRHNDPDVTSLQCVFTFHTLFYLCNTCISPFTFTFNFQHIYMYTAESPIYRSLLQPS